MKNPVLFFTLAIIVVSAHAQPRAPESMWRQTHADETDYMTAAVQQIGDGGFVVTGYRADFRGTAMSMDAYLWKVDSAGNTEWLKTIGSTDVWERPTEMCLTADGGLLLAGSRGDATQTGDDQADVYLLCTSAAGDSLWQRSYNLGVNDEVHSLAPTSDGGYILSGTADLNAPDYVTNMTVLKISAEGDSLWSAHFVSGRMADGAGAKPTPDGGVILVGTNRTGTAHVGHAYVVKLDAQGQEEWQRSYGRTNEQMMAADVVVTPDGGYAVIGCAFVGTARNNDAFLLRLSDTGDSLWMHYYGQAGRYADLPANIVLMPDSGFVIGGSAEQLNANLSTVYSMFELIGVSSTGDQQWLVLADSSQSGTASSLCLTRDMGYAMAGVDWNVANGTLHLNRFGASPNNLGSGPVSLPRTATLYQNYPNPFNPTTEIGFELARSGNVTLAVYDMLGREIARIADGFMAAGFHSISFDGSALPSGVYYYRLQSLGTTQARKMLLVK
jgi:hypothetical protein